MAEDDRTRRISEVMSHTQNEIDKSGGNGERGSDEKNKTGESAE